MQGLLCSSIIQAVPRYDIDPLCSSIIQAVPRYDIDPHDLLPCLDWARDSPSLWL